MELSERAKAVYQEILNFVELHFKQGLEVETLHKLMLKSESIYRENWSELELLKLLKKIWELINKLINELSKPEVKLTEDKLELIADLSAFAGSLRPAVKIAQEREEQAREKQVLFPDLGSFKKLTH